MCGITGIVAYRTHIPVDMDLLDRMTQRLHHRGPDGQGLWNKDWVGLGHRRLKILDLTDTAAQPMHSQDQRYVIVFNGEIYNHVQLRHELEHAGWHFSSRSDTEVLLHAYAQWGAHCLDRLIGMFAFAIWDNREKRLFAARDRIGEKPFLYADQNGVFSFASEFQSLRMVPGIGTSPDLLGLHLYFVYDHIPAPYSAFRDIRKLQPGYALTVDDSGVHEYQWWKLTFARKRHRPLREAAVEFRDLMQTVTHDTLQGDVPYGLLLSGGVDSGIVACETTHFGRDIHGFTVGGMEGKAETADLRRSRDFASSLSLKHHCELFHPTQLHYLPDILRHYGEPLASGPMLIADRLLHSIRDHVTILLSGNGADEVFGGYEFYSHVLRFPRLKQQLGIIAKAIGLARPGSTGWRGILNSFALKGSDWVANDSRRHATYLQSELEGPSLQREAQGFDAEAPLVERWNESEAVEPLDALLYTHLMVNNHCSHATIPDITGMRHSVEIRAPFLDSRVLNFATELPVSCKIAHPYKPEWNKSVLKAAYKGILPDSLLFAPKVGFGHGIVFPALFRGPWQQMARQLCLDGVCVQSGWIHGDHFRTMMEEHAAGKADWGRFIHEVFVAEVWARTCVQGETVQISLHNPC